MRTATFETTGSITYPEDVAFCFNPIDIAVQTTNSATVKVESGGTSFTDTRLPLGGNVDIDISMYVRLMFKVDGKSMVTSKVVSVTVNTSVDTFSFTFTAIWGAINIGEVFNAARTVTWFKNYPFTFSLYIAQGARIRTRYDNNKYTVRTLSSGIQHINPLNYFNPSSFGVIRIDDVEESSSTFEYTFDNTFRPVGDGVIINRLVVDDSDCGIYLRWIDRHGFYQYYLFTVGDKVTDSSAEGEKMNEVYDDSKYSYFGVSRYQGKSISRVVKACATLVSADTIDMLMTILSSPLVDMYADGMWIPVNISSGSFTRSMEHLQDFEISIEIPDIKSQML